MVAHAEDDDDVLMESRLEHEGHDFHKGNHTDQ